MPTHHTRPLGTVALLVASAALCVSSRLTAQAIGRDPVADSLSLSVQDAVQRLSSQHPELVIARANRAVAEAARAVAQSAARNAYLPSSNVSFSTQRLAQNQFTAIARRAGLAPAPIEQADPFTQVFAAANTRTATATAAVRPFDGGVARAQVDAAAHALGAARLDEGQTRAWLELQVIERYADVQLHRRLRQVAESALVQAERTLQIALRSREAGRSAAFEVWRAEAAVAAQRPAVVEASREAQRAELSLRQLLALPSEPALRLVSSAESWAEPGASHAADAAIDRSPDARLALRAASARERQAEAERRAAQRALLPVLDVAVQHQRFAYPLRGGDWRSPYFQNTTVAVTVALPLDLTGGTVHRIETATASLRLARAQRSAAEQAHAREVLDVSLLRESAMVAWKAAVAGVESAEQAYRASATRFEVGRASLLEVQDAQLAWQQAQAAQARAARDRTVAEARAARLHRLPLSTLQP